MPEIIISVSREIGKLKGNIKHLWELSKQSPLNREGCKNYVLEIRKSFKVLWELIREAPLERIRELDFEKRCLFTIIAGKDPEVLVKEFFSSRWPAHESEISLVISMLDSPEHYKDKEVKESISHLVESLEAELNTLEVKLDLKQGVSKVSKFLTTFPQFTENWAVAICYLTAMEIMVKNKLKELRLDAEEFKDNEVKGFKDNYEKLLEKLKEKDIQVSELEKQLPKIFWDIRNRVVHEGYSPASNELEVITTYVEKILRLLVSLK